MFNTINKAMRNGNIVGAAKNLLSSAGATTAKLPTAPKTTMPIQGVNSKFQKKAPLQPIVGLNSRSVDPAKVDSSLKHVAGFDLNAPAARGQENVPPNPAGATSRQLWGTTAGSMGIQGISTLASQGADVAGGLITVEQNRKQAEQTSSQITGMGDFMNEKRLEITQQSGEMSFAQSSNTKMGAGSAPVNAAATAKIL